MDASNEKDEDSSKDDDLRCLRCAGCVEYTRQRKYKEKGGDVDEDVSMDGGDSSSDSNQRRRKKCPTFTSAEITSVKKGGKYEVRLKTGRWVHAEALHVDLKAGKINFYITESCCCRKIFFTEPHRVAALDTRTISRAMHKTKAGDYVTFRMSPGDDEWINASVIRVDGDQLLTAHCGQIGLKTNPWSTSSSSYFWTHVEDCASTSSDPPSKCTKYSTAALRIDRRWELLKGRDLAPDVQKRLETRQADEIGEHGVSEQARNLFAIEHAFWKAQDHSLTRLMSLLEKKFLRTSLITPLFPLNESARPRNTSLREHRIDPLWKRGENFLKKFMKDDNRILARFYLTRGAMLPALLSHSSLIDGWTTLHEAVADRNEPFVDMIMRAMFGLLDSGVDDKRPSFSSAVLTQTDTWRWNPLHVLVQSICDSEETISQSDIKVMHSLCIRPQSRSWAWRKNKSGDTPLSLCIRANRADLLDVLASEAQLDEQFFQRQRALVWLAVEAGSWECLTKLIELGGIELCTSSSDPVHDGHDPKECISHMFDPQGESIWSRCVIEPTADSTHNTDAHLLSYAISRGNKLLAADKRGESEEDAENERSHEASANKKKDALVGEHGGKVPFGDVDMNVSNISPRTSSRKDVDGDVVME